MKGVLFMLHNFKNIMLAMILFSSSFNGLFSMNGELDKIKMFEKLLKASEQVNVEEQVYKVQDVIFVALEKIFEEARKGSDKAQLILGVFYEKGWGVEKDRGKSIGWIRKAAVQGLDIAQDLLGTYYIMKYDIEKNQEKAFKWFSKAAAQGLDLAQFNLGYCYEEGLGVEKDQEKALELYRKAATQGHTKAQDKLTKVACENSSDKKKKKVVMEFTAFD